MNLLRGHAKWMLLLICAMLLSVIPTFPGRQANQAEAAESSFRFVVMGDSRGASDNINKTVLRSLMKKVKGLSKQPDFVMFTGDLVQGGSNVERELIEWKGIVDDYYPIHTIFPSLGNHEHDEAIFSKVFTHLPNDQLSGYRRTAYYFDYGNARMITLNSDRKNSDGEYVISSAQRAWLEDKLKNSGQTHHFIQFHVPAYPIGHHYGRSLDASPKDRDSLWDIVDKYHVTAVFTGHEHNYNRRKIDQSFSGSGYKFEHDIYQITLGGAGAPLTKLQKNGKNVVSGPFNNYHYMVVDVVDGLARFKVYDINNKVLDSFEVNRKKTEALTTVSFRNGVYPSSSYYGTRDTTISQNDPKQNFGASTTLLADGDDPFRSSNDKSSLIKWDISTVPQGSKIHSAEITVYITNHSGGQSYSLYQVKRNWYESTATWDNYSRSYKWASPGADSVYDRGNAALGSFAGTQTGYQTFKLNDAGIALIEEWVNKKTPNYGFIIADSNHSNGLDWHSSESSYKYRRPKLSITYSR